MNQPIKKSASEEKVKAAFLKLLEQQSFSSIRVTSVAAACNISNQSFYRLFDNKYDLAVKALNKQLESCIAVSGNDATFRDLTNVILTIIRNNYRIYGNLLRDEEGAKLFPTVLSKLSSDWTGFTPARASSVIISWILEDWAKHYFSASVEEVYLRILYNLPACEFLSENELRGHIAKYENVKLRDFSNKNVSVLSTGDQTRR